jgi:hypothetical protein
MCAMKTQLTSHHQHQPAMLTHSMMDACTRGFLHTLVLPSVWNRRNWDWSDQAMYYQFPRVQCFHSLAHCSHSFFFFLLKEVELCNVVGCHKPFVSRYDQFFHGSVGTNVELECQSTNCNPCGALHNSCQPPLSSFINDPFSTTGLPLAGCPLGGGPFLIHTEHCWVRKTQQLCSSWHTQSIAPGISLHLQ